MFDIENVRANALGDAVEWARSCSGQSADDAADYIEEMASIHTADVPVGKMWFEGELVDDSESCDGSVDGYYVCSFPPCVVLQEADARFYGVMYVWGV